MFRLASQRIGSALQAVVRSNIQRSPAVVSSVRQSHGGIPGEEFDERTVKFLERSDIDGWDLRKLMNDMQGMDMIPEPKIIVAALQACRRVNDYALAVRYLEAIKDKCGRRVNEVWPYLLQEIRPTLDELGVLTPEEMGYDKPELACEEVHDMH